MVMTRRSVRGFTLIELMVVLVIAGVLAMIATPSFTKIIATQRLKSAASNLQIALLTARSEAIKRNANVCLSTSNTGCTGAGAWNQGWYVVDASNIVIASYPSFSSLTVNGPALGVTYQSSGRIIATPLTSGTNCYFSVASSSISDVRSLNISPNGAPAVVTTGC
jgi:type IV fimbrial biogenesis protein FimT